MENTLFKWLLEIPQAVANFGNWLVNPINSQYLNISPLGLLGVSGGAVILTLIGVHIVRLFI